MLQVLKGVRHLQSSALKHGVSELSVPVPWGEIRGKIWGPDHGCPVLCLHGWADNCGSFNTLIPLLPKVHDCLSSINSENKEKENHGLTFKCRYVAVDLAGHGLSSHRHPGVFYSFPLYVMDVCRVIDALQWSEFSIIGHSMGGNVAGMFSALYPEMVNAVVMLDSFGFLPTKVEEMSRVMRQGMDQMIQFEKKTKEQKRRVYSYENAVERLSTANPTLSEQSVHILLERGLAQVEGGVAFTRDVRINLKNIVRLSLEQSLKLQSQIKAPVLAIIAEDGFGKIFAEKESASALLQAYRDRNHAVVTVPGDHHIHLNDPGVVAPLVSDFLQTKVLSQPARL